jgi:hypothetical protein
MKGKSLWMGEGLHWISFAYWAKYMLDRRQSLLQGGTDARNGQRRPSSIKGGGNWSFGLLFTN